MSEDLSPGADHIEQEAARWLERQDFADLSREEERAFANWIAQSTVHRVTYVRLSAAWGKTARLAALRTPMRVASAAPAKPRWPNLLRHTVAVGAIAAISAFIVGNLRSPEGKIYTTDIGDREIITLADGSHVELNTNSVLRADVTAQHRIVTLERGEAYLDVKHDAKRPFVVRAQQYRITDLGTKFVVRSKPQRLEVSLVEGSAEIAPLNPKGDTVPIVMKPGDMVIGHDNRIALVKRGKHLIEEDLGWRRGVLVFDNITLESAVTELNRYNRQQLVISDPSIARLKIVGTFPATDIELVLAAAEDVYGLRVTHNGNTIRIHR